MAGPNIDDVLYPEAGKVPAAPAPAPAAKAAPKPKTIDDALYAEPKPVAPPKPAPVAATPKPAPTPKPPTAAKPSAPKAPVALKPPAGSVPIMPLPPRWTPSGDVRLPEPVKKDSSDLPPFSAYVSAEEQVAEAKKQAAEAEGKRVFVTPESTGAGRFAREQAEIFTKEMKSAAPTLLQLGSQAKNLADLYAKGVIEKALTEPMSPENVGALAFNKDLLAAREQVRVAKEAAADRFRQESQAFNEQEARRKEELAKKKAPPLVNELESQKLADSITESLQATKAGAQEHPSLTYYNRRMEQLRVAWGINRETDAAKHDELEELAKQKTLAELRDLYTRRGMTLFVPEAAVDMTSYLPESMQGNAARLAMAMLPQRKVTASGKIAGGESLPGYVLNTTLGALDFAVTTGMEALVNEQAPTLDMLIKNVDARRDPLTYQIENDDEIQADITSGDAWRVSRALMKLAPTMGLMMVSPDVVSTITSAAKVPGLTMDAARIAARTKDMVSAVQAAEGTAKVTAAIKALKKAAADVKAEKVVAATTKAAAKNAKFVVEKSAEVERALQEANGDVEVALDILDTRGQQDAAVLLRDNIAARMEADPDVKAFIDHIGASARPKRKADVRATVQSSVAEDSEKAAQIERGRAKYAEALERASNEEVAAFMTASEDTTTGPVKRGDVVEAPPEVSEEELRKAFVGEGAPAPEPPKVATPTPTPEPPKAPAPTPTPEAPKAPAAPAQDGSISTSRRPPAYAIPQVKAYDEPQFLVRSYPPEVQAAYAKVMQAKKDRVSADIALQDAIASQDSNAIFEAQIARTNAALNLEDAQKEFVALSLETGLGDLPNTTMLRGVDAPYSADVRSAGYRQQDPLFAKIEDALGNEPGNLGDVLRIIARESDDPLFRVVSERLLKQAEVRGTDIRIVPENTALADTTQWHEKSPGVAMFATGRSERMQILVRESSAHYGYANDHAIRVIVHEAVHSATQLRIEAVLGSVAAGRPVPEALRRAVSDLEDIHKIASAAANQAGVQFYGLYNLHEFVAEAFTSKAFQDFLKTVTVPEEKTTTLWGKFAKAVAAILFGQENSALSQTFSRFEALLEASSDKKVREAFWDVHSPLSELGLLAPEGMLREGSVVAPARPLQAAPTPAPTPAAPFVGPMQRITPKMAKDIGDAKTPAELAEAIGRLPEGVRDAVARRFGVPNYAALRKIAGKDFVANAAKKAAEIEAKLEKAREAAKVAADKAAALKMLPGQAKEALAAKEKLTAADKAMKEAAKLVRQAQAGTLPEQKAVSTAMGEVAKGNAAVAKAEKTSARAGEKVALAEDGLAKAQEAEKALKAQRPKGKAKTEEAYGKWLDKYDKVALKEEQAAQAVEDAKVAKAAADKVVADAKQTVASAEKNAAEQQALADAAVRKAFADEKTARDAYATALDNMARRQATSRKPQVLSPSATRFFSHTGEPVYRRGYSARPLMKHAEGKRAHLLDLALKADAEAAKKYIAGAETEDFARQLGNIEHVGAEAPHFGEAATNSAVYKYQVRGPDGKLTSFTKPAVQYNYTPVITWQPGGERLWAWAEKIFADNPRLPRAKTLNEYFRSLLAYADPAKSADEVSQIRLDDIVYVNDPEAAKQVGALRQPVEPFVDAAGKEHTFNTAVTEGFPARVVGFRIAADGTPVPILRPQEFQGTSLTELGDAAGKADIEVSPSALVYAERGRTRGTGAKQRPYTDAEWADLGAREDAMLQGAKPPTYADSDRFPKLAPPERPSPDSFNFNPDHRDMRKYFSDEEREAIRAEMAADTPPPQPLPGKVPTGAEYEKALKDADAAVEAAAKEVADLEAELDAARLTPQQVSDLQAATNNLAAGYADIGARLAQQEAYAAINPEEVILPAVEGRAGLKQQLDARRRTLAANKAIELDAAKVLTPSIWFNKKIDQVQRFMDGFGNLARPRVDVEQQALLPLGRRVLRRFQGEISRVSEDLARAFRSVDANATEANALAKAIFDEYQALFRSALLSGNAQADTIASVAEAYFRNASALEPEQRALLADQLIKWAQDKDSTFESLRADLMAVSGGLNERAPMRYAQEGDVHLAHAVAVEGAWRKTVGEAEAAGLAMNRETAQAANQTVNGIFGLDGQGGRGTSSLGYAALANVMVPEDYRAPIKSFADVMQGSRNAQEPMVAATSTTLRGMPPEPAKVADEAAYAVKRQEYVDRVAALLEKADTLQKENLYVPRALRDALDKELAAVFKVAAVARETGFSPVVADFYKQTWVLGTLTSKPNQVWMDFYGDMAGALTAGVGVKVVAKTAARSLLAQFLGTKGVAQASWLLDTMREVWRGSPVEAGQTARDILAAMTFTPEIHAITTRDPNFLIDGVRASEIHDVLKEYGVMESFTTGQFGRTVTSLQTRVQRGPFSGASLLFAANREQLLEMANIAATRRRVALAYTLMQGGMPVEEAARKTVEIVGNFAGELHPLEQNIIGAFFPFYSYRKFNARRALKALMNPYWMTRLQKGEQLSAQVASWYLDDSDEFGFHTDSMEDEFDPSDFAAILQQTIDDNGQWEPDSKEIWDEATRRAKAGVPTVDEKTGRKILRPIPKASERYKRMVERLREIARTQGRKAALSALDADPDVKILQDYFSPDPVRLMLEGQNLLPEYHQDRYPIFISDNRNQALASWYRANVGRFEKTGDDQLYRLFPGNPNVAALADVMLPIAAAAALGSFAMRLGVASTVVGANMVGIDVRQDTPAPGAWSAVRPLEGFFRTPAVQMLVAAGGEAPSTEMGYVVPNDAIGESLFRAGLAQKRSVIEEGWKVAEPTKQRTGYSYTIPPDVQNAALLVPYLGKVVYGAMDIGEFATFVSGERQKPAPEGSKLDTQFVPSTMFGQRLFSVSPSLQESIAYNEAKEAVKAAAETMPSETSQREILSPDVLTLRDMSRNEQSPLGKRAREVAVLDALSPGKLDPMSITPLRVYLRKAGLPDEQVVTLSENELIQKVREVARSGFTE